MAEWIGLGIVVLANLITVGTMWGKLSGRMDNAEEKLRMHAEDHERHFRHSGDATRHWTERERDALDSKLESMDQKLDKLLGLNGNERQR